MHMPRQPPDGPELTPTQYLRMRQIPQTSLSDSIFLRDEFHIGIICNRTKRPPLELKHQDPLIHPDDVIRPDIHVLIA
ncbi:MAG: hypothetical protein BWY82_00170 [Verrucomicrobia bacterium ADurb.Bin474]|nr:MAG: hypothetical protein BWY82_00170 [Verrucomicrobia bacterium ADurb.Bin474]